MRTAVVGAWVLALTDGPGLQLCLTEVAPLLEMEDGSGVQRRRAGLVVAAYAGSAVLVLRRARNIFISTGRLFETAAEMLALCEVHQIDVELLVETAINLAISASQAVSAEPTSTERPMSDGPVMAAEAFVRDNHVPMSERRFGVVQQTTRRLAKPQE